MTKSATRKNKHLPIEFKLNTVAAREICPRCSQELAARAGFIAFGLGSWSPLCSECSETGDLPLDFDRLAAFFDEWRLSRAYRSWRFTKGSFTASFADGKTDFFPAESVRQSAAGAAVVMPELPAETARLIPGRRTSQQILDQTNDLARIFYSIHDRGGKAVKGFRFDLSEHPQEAQCWRMACEAQKLLTETDLDDVLSDLED